MFKVIYCMSIVLTLLGFLLSIPKITNAQVAPTNSATISGSVSDSVGKPMVNAKVLLNGPKTAVTQADAQGLFIFVGMPFGTYSITAVTTGLGTATRTGISVQGDTNVAIQYEPALNGLKVIANVSSSANAQFNVTPASITQVNPIANVFEGKTSWRTILEQIPGVAQAGLHNGEDTLTSVPDSPFMPMQISINGALPYETATLLDDMPLIGGSYGVTAGTGTDLSVYPLNGFGSADVVRGPGANAPSIVDSIGGSFVLHSPGMVTQNHYNFSLSNDAYGGGIANVLVAIHIHKLSLTGTYGINNSPGPVTSAQVLSDFVPSMVNGQSFSPYQPPCTPPTCAFGSILHNPNYAGFAFYGVQSGLFVCCGQESSAWNQHSGSIALNYALSASVGFGVFYAGSSMNQLSTPFRETDNFIPPPGYGGSLPIGQYELTPVPGTNLQPAPFSQASSLLEEKITVQLGQGVLRLAALQNRTFDSSSSNALPNATVQLFGGGYLNGSSTITLFNGGNYSATFNGVGVNIVDNAANNNRDFLLNYETFLGSNIHAGASYVKSYYNFPQYQIYNGFYCYDYPSAISQTTNELRLFAGGNPSKRTSLDLSMYFANANYHVPDPNNPAIDTTTYNNATYSDTRYTYAAPRLGFVWRPTASLAIRMAAGGGFAEAPLFDLIGSNGAPNCSSGTFCTVMLTNLNLQPEKSFAFDLGTDIRLPRNTVLSFDVYRSNLYGQLYNSTALNGTFLGLPLYTTQYGNLGESRYEGVLIDLRHDTPHGAYWSLSGGLTRGYVISVPAGFYNTATCTNCNNLAVVPNINFNGTFAVSIPYAQGLGTLGYRWNQYKYIDLSASYYGNNNTYFRPAFVEIDGNLSYPITKNVSFFVIFRNITGIYDNTVGVWSPANMVGAPTISGLPQALYAQEYGPRTVQITTQVHL